jgi:serine protease Do
MSVERIDQTWHGLVVRCDGREGAVVEAVHRRSPAESMGVKAGDRITRIGELAVARQLDVERALIGHKAGESIPVTMVRSGGEEQIELSLAEVSRDTESLDDRCWAEIGLRLQPAPAAKVQKLQARYRGGLVVTAVREGGPAAEQGIQEGDILVGLHVWETIAPDNVSYILDKAIEEHLNPIKFYVLRGRETLFGHMVSDTVRR